jgi:hypothetical protein
MKKVITLAIAMLLAGFITGCGGGGGGGGSAATAKPSSSSAGSSSASSGTANVSTAETQVKLTSADKAANITYKSVASGEFPPAPPVNNAPDASSAIN